MGKKNQNGDAEDDEIFDSEDESVNDSVARSDSTETSIPTAGSNEFDRKNAYLNEESSGDDKDRGEEDSLDPTSSKKTIQFGEGTTDIDSDELFFSGLESDEVKSSDTLVGTPEIDPIGKTMSDIGLTVEREGSFVNFEVSFDDALELGQSEEYDDSFDKTVIGGAKGWGKQSPDATPMSSLESPTKSKGSMASPKLNDRLVVAEGEAEKNGNPDYRIVAFLGEGAMGKVFVARQTSVDRDVAFKKQIEKKSTSSRKKIRNRNKFLFEAQVTANLDHPNIVSIYDMGRDQNGEIFYCMELVRGDPWGEVIGKMSLEENLEVLKKVINGIAYAHSRETIHRDLKPENIMLGSFGEVLIMDWGLGVNLSHGPPTNLGGTPGFMAPEMAQPPETAVGTHSDIYLLGAMLFMITIGESPHSGDDVSECLKNAADNVIVAPPADRKVDERLLSIAYKAMSTNPLDRYVSAEQMKREVENYQSHLLSIKLAERSQGDLNEAVEARDYESFSKSLFGFRESLALWDENDAAADGVQRARLAYAQCALERQDFELGMSLLNASDPDEAPLYRQLQGGANASVRRRRMVWIAIASSIMLLAALVVTSMLNANTQRINAANLQIAVQRQTAAKNEAELSQAKAEAERATAEKERVRADEQRELAVEERTRADEQRERAEKLAQSEQAQKKLAQELAVKEKAARKDAESLTLLEQSAREKAEQATAEKELQRSKATRLSSELQISEKSARERLFQSNIGLIDGNIRDNQVEQAINALTDMKRSDSRFMNWEWNRLYHLCHTEVKSEYFAGVSAIDQSDDGTSAMVSENGMVKFLNPRIDKTAFETKAVGARALCVSLSPDGRYAAIGSADSQRKLTIWDVNARQLVTNLSSDISASLVSSVCFNNTGTQLAVGDSAMVITLFNGQGTNWQASNRLRFHSRRPTDLDYSKDDRLLASVSRDGLSVVWNSQTGSPYSAFEHPGELRAVAFHPGVEGLVACATADREVVFWDASKPNDPLEWQKLEPASLKRAKSAALSGSIVAHKSSVNDVDFSNDGKVMMTCGDDRTIAVWNFAEKTLQKRFRGHVNAVTNCKSDRDGRGAVSASADGQVRFWRFDQYEDQRVFTKNGSSAVQCVDFNRAATQLLTGDSEGVITVWNRDGTSSPQSNLKFDPKLGRHAVYLAASERIVTSSPGNVFVWNNGTLEQKQTVVGEAGIVACTSDERLMITGGDADHPTIAWDLQTGEKVATLLDRGDRNRVTAMAVSPDDRYLAMGTGQVEGLVSVFDLATFTLVDEAESHRGWISDLKFSPTSNQFISADSIEGYVNVWSILGNRIEREKKLEGIGGSFIRIAYSADGRRFATSANKETNKSELQVWDSESKLQISKSQLAKQTDFISFINDEVVFHLTNGKAYAWQHSVGPRAMRSVSAYSNSSYSTTLNGWNYLSDNKSLVYGDGFVKIIDTNPKQNDGSNRDKVALSVFKSAGNPGRCVLAKFADQERQIVALYEDGAVRFWDRKTSAVVNAMQSGKSRVVGLDVLAGNSKMVALCDSRGFVQILNAETGKIRNEIETGLPLTSVKWLDETTMVVSAETGVILLVNLETSTVKKLNSSFDAIRSVDVSAEGKVVVGVGTDSMGDGRVVLWQQVDGEWLENPRTFGLQVLSTRVSPDGYRVFSGDVSGAVTVWYIPEPGSTDAPRKLISLLGHEKGVSSIAISKDSSQVASSSEDGTAILWLATETPE
ncbi:protein kinase [bacterium]|nr:protein kinase [bacterium]